MNTTELLKKKYQYYFSDTNQEEELFLNQVVYKDFNRQNGLSLKELKKIIPLILSLNGRVHGLEVIDSTGKSRDYC